MKAEITITITETIADGIGTISIKGDMSDNAKGTVAGVLADQMVVFALNRLNEITDGKAQIKKVAEH